MRKLTAQCLSGSRGRFTASTPVLMRPFLVMNWSTRSISCTQRTRTKPRTMMFRAHFWEVSTSFRKTGKTAHCFEVCSFFWSLIFLFLSRGEDAILIDPRRTLQFLFQEARIRLRRAKYMVGSRENSGNS